MRFKQQIKNWLEAIREYPSLIKEYKEQDELLFNMRKLNRDLEEDVEELMKELVYTKNNESLEEYWNTKRPVAVRTHPARDGVRVDVRVFFQQDGLLPTISGTNDEKAKKALNYVINMIKYTSDNGEFWQYAYETLLTKTGDCEDGAILLANMMIMSGVPYWRVRLNKGYVQGGYHAWCTYLREKDNKWVVLDWCYWAGESKWLNNLWSKAEKYYNIDCSWNTKYSFGGKENFDR